MTQDELIAMAREAGCEIRNGHIYNQYTGSLDQMLKRFTKLVAAHEQNRCCAIVFSQCDSDNVAQRTVDAIRGQQ